MIKKIPLRMCIACRTMQDKKNLVRIVKNNEDEIFIDYSNKANGRGAYICNNKECFEKCKKTKALNRAFKCEVDDKILKSLEDKIGLNY